ncbi:MAG: TetR/AcrR family transcriptional regulator [Saprospiraceae bacterium]
MSKAPISQRHRILTAAATLFQQQGYPATSVRMIAASVELGASSLYNHIEGKQELLKEICFSSAERFELGLNQLKEEATSTPDLLKGLIRLHVKLAVEYPETVTVFNDEWRHLDQEAIQPFLRKRKDYQTEISRIFKEGQRKGDISPIDLEIAVLSLLGSLSWIYQRKGLFTAQVEDITQQLYTLWANGWQLK